MVTSVTCCTIGCYSNSTFALPDEPVISCKFNNVPLEVVLQEIDRQTGFKVSLDHDFKGDLFTGEYDSVELTTFLNNILKNRNTFITVSTDTKTIRVRIADRFTTTSVVKESVPPKGLGLQNNISPFSTYSKKDERNITTDGSRYGGIHELPPLPATKEPTNNKHIIDSQTGLEWELAEKLL